MQRFVCLACIALMMTVLGIQFLPNKLSNECGEAEARVRSNLLRIHDAAILRAQELGRPLTKAELRKIVDSQRWPQGLVIYKPWLLHAVGGPDNWVVHADPFLRNEDLGLNEGTWWAPNPQFKKFSMNSWSECVSESVTVAQPLETTSERHWQ